MKILILEPFYGGSHKQLIDLIQQSVKEKDLELITQTAKKWHWRARSSAVWYSQKIEDNVGRYSHIFSSSVLNLCELFGLRPDLKSARSILYFHENQLVYPVQTVQDRDFQFGYNQILSALAADELLFNSEYNLSSFLQNIPKHFKIQPDFKPDTKIIVKKIRDKSRVLYFPIYEELKLLDLGEKNSSDVLHIVWAHRWEHDKNPESFFQALYKLHEEGFSFKISVLGETYSQVPPIFEEARSILSDHILQFGFAKTKEEYYSILRDGDVIVSTAIHEFFGVSMLEGFYLGCFPLVPNRLVYPEIYSEECIYNTDTQLYKKLRNFIRNPSALRSRKIFTDFQKFSIKPFLTLFE